MPWPHLKGHEVHIQEFTRAVHRGRLAHAYLFTGPNGVGKRLFAVQLAKALLCEAPPAGEILQPCGHCPACIQIDSGTYPDFFYARRPEEALEFPIELMRELCKSFSLKSARGRGKVVVLDDVDDLNEESANCFLKTLEEPPPRSVLILIGSSTERQLPTIVSRCQVVRFTPLPAPLVREILQEHGIEDAALLDRVTRLSGGSPGLALALADPALWDFRRTFLDGLAHTPPDSVGLAEQCMEFVAAAGKESAPQRQRAHLLVKFIVDFLSDALAQSVAGPVRRTEAADRPALEKLVGRLSPEQLLELLERCLDGAQQIDRRVQLVLIVEALCDALGQQLRIGA